MTIQETKNQTAKNSGWFDWDDLVKDFGGKAPDTFVDKAMENYGRSKWQDAIEEMRCISNIDSDCELPEFEP